MNREEIEKAIVEAIRIVTDLPPDYPVPTDLVIFGSERHLLGGIEIDSLYFTELIVALSATYELTFEALDVEDASTVQSLANHIHNELQRSFGMQTVGDPA